MTNVARILAGAGAVLVPSLGAAAQSQMWIHQFGTSGHEFAEDAASDGVGGVYIGGTGSFGAPSGGGVWLARHDGAGNQAWLREFGTSADEWVDGLAPAGAGGAYVTGYTTGNLGGPNAGSRDVFLAQYDGVGNQVWIRQFGTPTIDRGTSVAPDLAGGVYIAGHTDGNLGGLSAGYVDVFLTRYDSGGNQDWIRQFGTTELDNGFGVSMDGAGGAYLAGYSYGSLGGPSAGAVDGFLARYDNAGNRAWISQFGTGGADFALSVAPDGADGAYVTGYTDDRLAGANAGSYDVLLARYDGAGNQIWIRQFGTAYWDGTYSVVPDGAGGAYVGGWTEGSLFGLNPLPGAEDIWLARYDATGNRLWSLQFGTPVGENARGLAPGAQGVYITGRTSGSLGGPGAGGADVWLARFGTCYPDCTGDGAITVADFGCFQTKFVAGDAYADCNGDGARTVADFGCFQTKFVAGCP